MNVRVVETYTPGHSDNSVSFMARRSAATHAAFFTPLLKPGMRVLDCGCGPGGITLDLARLVAPGETIGLDRSGEQFGEARNAAIEAQLPATFRTGSIYGLPFDDASLDAVLAHAVFEHLGEPEAAAAEIRRVLKPGGFCGLRSPDWGGFLLQPCPDDVRAAVAAYQAKMVRNGGDPHAGRKLPGLLRAAGFARLRRSASYEVYPHAAVIADYLAVQLEPDDAGAATALRDWARHPDAMFAQAWVEAVGWRD